LSGLPEMFGGKEKEAEAGLEKQDASTVILFWTVVCPLQFLF